MKTRTECGAWMVDGRGGCTIYCVDNEEGMCILLRGWICEGEGRDGGERDVEATDM